MTVVHQVSRLLAAAFVLAAGSSAFAADDGAWTVSKSSGEVWLSNTGAQPVSLKQQEALKPGDTIRTGRTGRVLLQRGEETMMISPNSVVGVPTEKKEGLSTTIVQQAGSVLLEVEKRNVKHFEVETPYLAAVVKGTQFRVTVNATSTSVDVIRGQVEVADFRTGQIAQVKPGQHATTFANGKGGLSLGGSGTFSPIEQGKPRAPTIERVPVPRAGLTAPRNAAIGHAIQPTGQGVRGDKA
jgi:ferric-dicitrate binding protein FerR (iron transport regulator)